MIAGGVVAALVLGGLLLGLMRSRWRALEAERRLSIAQENTGVGLFEIDLRERTIFASPSLMKMFGRTPRSNERGQMMPLDEWNATASPEELADARGLLRSQLALGADAYEREHFLVLPDGQGRWFHSKMHIERDRNGRAVRLRGASIDIAERKRTTALLAHAQTELMQQVADLQRLQTLSVRVLALDDLESRLDLILQTLIEFCSASHGMVALAEPDADVLRVGSQSGFRIEAGKLQSLEWLLARSSGCGLAFARKHRVLVNDSASEAGDEALRRLRDQYGVRALVCTPLFDADRAVCGVLSLYFDRVHAPSERELRLTDICAGKAAVFIERERARATARESDLRFRLALESSALPFGLFVPVRNENGSIVDFRWSYANSAAARALDTDAGALPGRAMRDSLPADWDAEALLLQLSAVVALREPRQFELGVPDADGERWFHAVASPLQDAVALWFSDITSRKQDEQQLKEADRRKDEFLAVLAHELRNPLAPIRQAVTIARTAGASETQKRWSHDVIERQVLHMALLLDDLLDVSRITRGMLHLRPAPALLEDVVESAVETARPLIETRAHRLLLDIPPAVRFEADPLRVAQILGNLLTNAAKYTDPGGTIRINADRRDGQLRICVIDNGIGIPRDKLDSVFEMFSQVRAAHERTAGGLGIGLALARGLAELHGGSLHADSDGPGRGSRFTLRLPLRVPSDSMHPADSSAPSHQRRRILVADDNRDAAETLAEFLRMEGHEVQVAYDGLEALAGIKRFAPEIALLDIGMPGLSGNEVAQRARTTEAGRNATLVAVTGWGQEKDRALALASGFGHHMTKPVDLMRLRKLIDEV